MNSIMLAITISMIHLGKDLFTVLLFLISIKFYKFLIYFINSSNNSRLQSNASNMRQPEISKAKLKCKTPVHYGSDKNLRDLKTPVGIKNGRWSPIKIHSSKSIRLFEVCF